MTEEFKTLIACLDLNPAAPRDELLAAESALRISFPNDYIEFMMYTNGAEGALGNSEYVAIWSASDLVERNNGYCVNEFASGLVLIGSDGGNTGYAFDSRIAAPPIVSVPLGGMDLREVQPCGATFTAFISRLSLS